MTATGLEIAGLVAGYGEHPVLDRLDLTVERGSTLAVLGPSGSGKTTLLLAIAGFVAVRSGRISVGGRHVAGEGVIVPPERRRVAMVFQGYGLWPHLDARSTVAFPMEVRGMARSEAAIRAEQLLDSVGLAGLGDRRPAELSGGQQQRVGLARALATDAELLLLDEPTAHLDAATRAEAGRQTADRLAEAGLTAVLATHDAGEALATGDRVVLLRDGAVAQSGSPREVYEAPVDEWAARLTGPVSVLAAAASPAGEGRARVTVGAAESDVAFAGRPGDRLLVRPEWATLGGDLPGVVAETRFRGPHVDVVLTTPAGPIELRVPANDAPPLGAATGWTLTRAVGSP